MTDTTDTIANAVATITAFMRSHKCKTIGQAYDLPQFPVGALGQALPGYEWPEISGLTARQLSNRAIPRYRDEHAKRHLVAGGHMYTCRVCGKRTRDTGGGEDSCQLCWTCFEEGGLENEHSDSGHPQPVAGCPTCRALAEAKPVTEQAAPTPVFDQALVAQLDRALAEQEREQQAEHADGQHLHHEPGCGLCERERLADGMAVEAAAESVPLAVLRQLADRLRRFAIQDLQSERRWLQAAADQPQRARDHQLVATHCCSRAEGWQRAAEEVDAVIAIGCMK
jgi:hypothetical protein